MIKNKLIFPGKIKQHRLLYFSLLLSVTGYSQFNAYNLVPNPSFEQYSICPNGSTANDLRNAKPDYWYKPDLRNADYLNACSNNGITGVPYNGIGGVSFQVARTGQAYMSMFYYNGMDARNYVQVQLLDSLRKTGVTMQSIMLVL